MTQIESNIFDIKDFTNICERGISAPETWRLIRSLHVTESGDTLSQIISTFKDDYDFEFIPGSKTLRKALEIIEEIRNKNKS